MASIRAAGQCRRRRGWPSAVCVTAKRDPDQARDIAFVLGNAETDLQFTDVCGWTPDEWQERTAAVLTTALVAP